jgi:hypothetical protein
MRLLILASGAIMLAAMPSSANAQVCDRTLPGNALIRDPAKCRVRGAEANGIVITLPSSGQERIDPVKVQRCTAIGAQLMKHMNVAQEDFISPSRTFMSKFTFRGTCAAVTLDCQVFNVSQPELNRPPWGSVAARCDASAERIAMALQIIAPNTKAAAVRDFVTKCHAAARAGKAEGPTDREEGSYLLICDPQHPDGPQVRVEPQ